MGRNGWLRQAAGTAVVCALGAVLMHSSSTHGFDREDYSNFHCEGPQPSTIYYKFSGAAWNEPGGSDKKQLVRDGAAEWNSVVDHTGNQIVNIVENASHPDAFDVYLHATKNDTSCFYERIRIKTTNPTMKATATHEFGHALGLDHSGSAEGWISGGNLVPFSGGKPPVMFFCAASNRHTTPSVDDQSAVYAFHSFGDHDLPHNGVSADRGFEGVGLSQRSWWNLVRVGGAYQGSKAAQVTYGSPLGTRIRTTTPSEWYASKLRFKRVTSNTTVQIKIWMRSLDYSSGPTTGCGKTSTAYSNSQWSYSSFSLHPWKLKGTYSYTADHQWDQPTGPEADNGWIYHNCANVSPTPIPCDDRHAVDYQIQIYATNASRAVKVDNVWINSDDGSP